MPQPQFIDLDGIVINAWQISYLDFRTPGMAMVHIGANSIKVEGEAAVSLYRCFHAGAVALLDNPLDQLPGTVIVPGAPEAVPTQTDGPALNDGKVKRGGRRAAAAAAGVAGETAQEDIH